MKRLRLVFISEFDYDSDILTEGQINDLVEQFIENPESFVCPVDEDEETIIEVQDITNA